MGKGQGAGRAGVAQFLRAWLWSASPQDKVLLCNNHMVPGEKPANLSGLDPSPSPGSSLLPTPVLVSPRLSDTPSSGRSQAVLAALPLEDNSCSFLSLPVAQAEHLQLFSQASRCFSAHSAIPPSLPGPELA